MWESFSDEVSESQRELEVSLSHLSSFEESFEQFQKWLTEITSKVKVDSDLKATLQEKKMQLQSHKVGF